MTLPKLTFTELDGQLGTMPSGGQALAITGPASSGAFETPTAITRAQDATASFGRGPGPEAVAYAIKTWGLPVVFCRLNTTTPGSATIDASTHWTGAAATLHTGSAPIDDLEIVVTFPVGGTRGTAGIIYQVSYDNGRTFGVRTALGTAIAITLDASIVGTLVIDFAAGAVNAGEYISVKTVAPTCTANELTAAVGALGRSAVSWEFVEIATPITPTLAAAADTAIATMKAAGKKRFWMGNTALPTTALNTAANVASAVSTLQTSWASYASSYASVFAWDCYLVSAISGLEQTRPKVFAAAPFVAKLAIQQDPAKIDLGSLPGVRLADPNGNPDKHDEFIFPGADDLGFSTFRTWPNYRGVYIGNCRMMVNSGSDFEFVQARRVMNVFETLLDAYFNRRLSSDVPVNAKTGKILEHVAQEIEKGGSTYCYDVLGQAPSVSAPPAIVLSRTDNILSTKTVNVDASVIPLGYIKAINITTSYKNPAATATGA